ncbi:sulfatase [Puniceicoccaceae bacterium K14]|nr:sulfatase [Puniceicoccaceae bacterium K14]
MKTLFALALFFASSALFAADRPNIIFLMSDDQNTYSVGCYGNEDVSTPNMDKLGEEGMIFDKHYVTTAICMASRATVFTGMYEYKTGCNFEHGDMKPEIWEKSYPRLLREAGYRVAFAGKFGMEVEGRGLCEDDFDRWGGGPGQTNYWTNKNESMRKYAEEYPHSTVSYGAFGRDVIRDWADQDQPFCLSVSFKAPHKPAIPDPQFDEVYAGKAFTKPGNYGREHGEHMSEQSKTGRQYDRFTSWGYSDEYDQVMAIYHQQVHAIDVAVGMIREELEEQGIADNTVIIYTSDNGFICGSHGYGSKVLPMEESSRVPLIIYDPRASTNGQKFRCEQLTASIDFAPTILELAGVEAPSNMDGRSLLGLLEEPHSDVHDQVALINAWGGMGKTVSSITSLSALTKKYKYTYWWYASDGMYPVEELYDLEIDPLELKNLALDSNYDVILEEMREKYDHELSLWKQQVVDYNDYEKYGVLFDRGIPWEQKLEYID